jgi:hypothetical protein
MSPMSPRLLRPRATGTFRPTNIPNLAGWWDASDPATLFDATTGGSLVSASGAVARWEDKSGNGFHATQGTANNRPLRLAAQFNGRDALDFDGSNDSLGLASNITLINGASIIVVAQKQTNASGAGMHSFSGAGASDRNHHPFGDNNYYDSFGRTTRTSTAMAFDTNLNVFSTIAGSQWTLRRNNVTLLQNSYTASNQFASRTQAFGTSDQGLTSFCWDGLICEVLVYTRGITDSENAQIYEYLRRKWGIGVPPSASNADAQDWINRVYANGGTVSTSTAAAVNTFCNDIDTAGIRDRFYRLNLFCGTGLNAVLVPLYRGPSRSGTQFGDTTDTNNGPFVSGDYVETGSTGGLNGNGTSKFLATGLNPFDAGMVETDFHTSGYFRESINTSGVFIGCVNSAAQRGVIFHPAFQTLGMYVRFGGLSNSGIENGTLSTRSGFLLGVRRPGGAGFRNGANINATSITTGSLAWNASSASPALFVFNRNDQQAVPSNQYFNGRSQAYSIGLSMTDQQAADFHTAMQAFQTALTRNV